MSRSVSVAAVAAVLMCTSTTFAFEQWNVTGTSCVADAGSIFNQLYLGTGGTVRFATGKTRNIVLYCPVGDPGFKPRLLGLVYYDDSRDLGAQIEKPTFTQRPSGIFSQPSTAKPSIVVSSCKSQSWRS
jgi:hypothetical protein